MTSKPNLFRVSLSVALVALLLSLLCAPIAALADGLQDHVYVYAITDFHGHVEQGGEVAGMLDEVRGEYEADGVDFGCFAVTDTGAVADRAGLANKPHAGQAHVSKRLTDEELATFGGRDATFFETGLLAGDGMALEDASATYVNFDELPGEASAEQLFLRRCRRGLVPVGATPGEGFSLIVL